MFKAAHYESDERQNSKHINIYTCNFIFVHILKSNNNNNNKSAIEYH